MKLEITALKTERHWRSSTGISQEKFYELLPHFGRGYEGIYDKTIEERTSESPNSPSIRGYEDLLFFTLIIQLKKVFVQ
jgi:hypothetical protein